MTLQVPTPIIANWHPTMSAWVEVYDVSHGRSKTLLQANYPLQAPTWSTDGQSILLNANGTLFQVNATSGNTMLQSLHFDGLHSSNNDHGYSPDGTHLAITDMSEVGRSAVYVVELGQTSPRRLTAKTPSWFHGWAPDSQSVLYACIRNGRWAIGQADIHSGEERILIQSTDSDAVQYDCPEFTPDGDWVWFNCDRSGDMSLWRMRPDGSDPQQMTFGPSQDWFPHPSPDGSSVVYLSYAPGVRGHPFGRDIELRMMPMSGGAAKGLAAIFGGHGTLNAPCWSPTGDRFAYIRYSRCAQAHLVSGLRIIPEESYVS